MAERQELRSMAENIIQNRLTWSQRAQRGILATAITAGAFAGVHETTDGEIGLHPNGVLPVAIGASIAGSQERRRARRYVSTAVQAYAEAIGVDPAERYKHRVLRKDGVVFSDQVERDQEADDSRSLSMEPASLPPILSEMGILFANSASTNPDLVKQGQAAPVVGLGLLLLGAGAYIHRMDQERHTGLRRVSRRQLDNIDGIPRFE